MLFEKMKNYKENLILSRSKGSHNKEILHSLCSLRMTGDRTAPSLIVRANLRTDKAKRVRIASRLSRQEQCSVGDTLRAWSKFKTGQNFLKNVVNLEIRERVKGKEILRSFHSLRMTKDKGVNVFSLSKGEGNKKRKELINLSTYPLINFQKAFTLVEVLITLGIIGVVAAMTIPNLINHYQKHVIETRLKEDYSIFTQVMRRAQDDEIPFDDNITSDLAGNKKWFETFVLPYLKTSRVCYSEPGCWHKRGATRNLAGNTVYLDHNNIGIGQTPVTMKLTNGSNINFDWYSPGSMKSYFGIDVKANAMIIFIDANGDNPPNVIGKDIYIMGFIPDKGFVPAGYSESNETINNNCSQNARGINAGYFCMSRIKNNGWEIPNDVWKIKI